MLDGLGDFAETTDQSEKTFIEKLTADIWQFSGAKTYAQSKAITEQLVDAAGRLRTFRDFKFEAGKINEEFVGPWLKAEYNNAVASSQMAAKWQRIEADKETLPWLKFVTVGDDRVRLDHQELEGIVRKVDDAFWNTYYPPLGWNCRCDVQQLSYVKKETDLNKKTLPDIPALFQYNAGKTAQIFPPSHPYYNELPENFNEQIKKAKG